MSSQFRRVHYASPPDAAGQNPENRSTDPTPLKDPSGKIPDSGKEPSFFTKMPITDVLVLSGASAITYDGINYLYHKVGKTDPKDPNAIKDFKAGKLLTGGLMQMGASAASLYTSMGLAQYMPAAIGATQYFRPLITGAYKTGLTMALKKKPSFWAGFTDFAMSAGADYVGPGAAFMAYAAVYDAKKKLFN